MKQKILFAVFVGLIAGCSSPTYKPEISGKGVIYDRGAVVYSVPPQNPVVKLRISYRGVEDDELTLHIRFIRKASYDPLNPILLDPKEQTLDIGDSKQVTPVRIHASPKERPLIELSQDKRQAIDLVYKIPVENGKVPQFPYFNFHWKLQIAKGDSQEKVVRFDRKAHTTTGSEAFYYDDVDFAPYGENDSTGWYPTEWNWW